MRQVTTDKMTKKELLSRIKNLQSVISVNKDAIDDLRVRNNTLECELSRARRENNDLQERLTNSKNELARTEGARDKLDELVRYAMDGID